MDCLLYLNNSTFIAAERHIKLKNKTKKSEPNYLDLIDKFIFTKNNNDSKE